MDTIKVSIIVPVYNVEKLLPRCLDSLVGQTLEGVEIICVNDASPDKSIDILRDYESRYPQLRVLDLKENVRQGGARNRGIDLARGEYIGFVDSDDYVDLRMYEKLYIKAMQTGADIVSCGYDVVGPDGAVLRTNLPDKTYFSGEVNPENRQEVIILPKVSTCVRIFKKTLLDSSGVRFPEKIFAEDIYFTRIINLYAEHFEWVYEPLYNYYQNLFSTTQSRNSKNVLDHLIIINRVCDYFKQNGFDKRYSNALDFFVITETFYNAVWYIRSYDRPQVAYVQNIRERLRPLLQRKNPFYKRIPFSWRILMRMLMFNPMVFIQLRHVLKAMKR